MAHHHGSPFDHAEKDTPVRRTASFILAGLSGGHGIFHWFNQSFLVMLPDIQDAFGLSKVQVGAITATREIAGGLVMLPSGIILDILRPYWGVVLSLCMLAFGLGWILTGLSPIYPIILVGMVIVSVASSIWHLPAMGALSHHFEHRKGTALSFHGIGGSLGDFIGPLATGAILTVMSWRGIISIYAVVPLTLTFIVFWAFRDIGTKGVPRHRERGVGEQLQMTRQLMKSVTLWVVMFVAGLRGMAYLAVVTFLPIYMDESLEFGTIRVGFYIGMLVFIGILATPTLGYLSDRIGRKVVIVPSLLAMTAVSFLLAPYGEGWQFTTLIAALGLFLYSDQPILTAAALDMVDQESQGSMLGILSFERIALGGLSPIFAGLIYDHWGMDYVFYYAAGLLVASATLLMTVKLGRRERFVRGGDGHGHGHHHDVDHGDGHGHGHGH